MYSGKKCDNFVSSRYSHHVCKMVLPLLLFAIAIARCEKEEEKLYVVGINLQQDKINFGA